MRNLHIICTPSPKMAKYAVKETPIGGGFLGVDAVVDRMRGTFYDSVGWSGVGYVIHNYDEGEIGAALDYMLSAVRVREHATRIYCRRSTQRGEAHHLWVISMSLWVI